MTVMEDASLGTRVGRLQAFDSDVGQNAVFEYAITHANIGKVPYYLGEVSPVRVYKFIASGDMEF